MPTPSERSRSRLFCSAPRWCLASALALSALVGACALQPPPPPLVASPAPGGPDDRAVPPPAPASSAPTAPPPSPVPAMPPAAGAGSGPAAVAGNPVAAGPAEPRDNGGVPGLLRYADRVRALTPPELASEIAALGEPGPQPARQLQLAIALMHSSQPVDTARALGLAQRAAGNSTEEAAPYRSLARLLANRLLEQRKLEDTADRQTQLARELQRRIDQLNDRLEAMRAIERSINNRAPARPPTP